MTKLLQEAFSKAAALPEHQQDVLAALVMAEMEDEAAWDEAFASFQDELAHMAGQALAEYRAGQTKPLARRVRLAAP